MADDTNTAVAETPVVEAEAIEQYEAPSLQDLFSNEPVKDAVKPEATASPEPETEEASAEPKTDEIKDEGVTPSSPEIDKVKAEADARIKETRVAYDRLAQEKAELQRAYKEQAAYLEMINKKLDGNWTEEDEKAMQAPQTTPEQAAHQGHTEGKIAASRVASYDIFGKETVEKTLFADDAPFRAIMDDPIVAQKVLSSDAPVIEAMKIVQLKQFYDKWGYEPAAIEKNMRESIEKELTEKITQKVMKQMSGKSNISTGLRDVRGEDVRDNTVYNPPTTKELFG